MHEATEAPLLKRAHGAAADGDWRQAYELLTGLEDRVARSLRARGQTLPP